LSLRPTPVALFAALLGGCGEAVESDLPDLPVEDTDLPVDDPDTDFPIDTDLGGPGDEVPEHWLYMYQDGNWRLDPSGGPYTTSTGTLQVQEFLDWQLPPVDTGDTDPDSGNPWDEEEESPVVCLVTYTLVGAVAETACGGCTFAMDVEFRVADGDPSACRDPELPEDGEVWRLGWRESDQMILLDYGGVGSWFPWYHGERAGNTISFTWAERLAVSIEEEEED
jgi:hypothetical protein